MSRDEWRGVALRMEAASRALGLDLVHAFNLADSGWASLGVPPPFGGRRPRALGVLLGNTRALWPTFTRALQSNPSRAQPPHPLDRYVTEGVSELVARATPHETALFFSHVTEPAPFPIARLAERVGLCSLSPSHLAVHPVHGPWLALRAVILVDVDGPDSPVPAPVSPCATCSAPCVAALERALAVSGSPLDSAAIAQNAPAWIAVRDACPVGRASRYDEAQLQYHYSPATSKLTQGS